MIGRSRSDNTCSYALDSACMCLFREARSPVLLRKGCIVRPRLQIVLGSVFRGRKWSHVVQRPACCSPMKLSELSQERPCCDHISRVLSSSSFVQLISLLSSATATAGRPCTHASHNSLSVLDFVPHCWLWYALLLLPGIVNVAVIARTVVQTREASFIWQA